MFRLRHSLRTIAHFSSRAASVSCSLALLILIIVFCGVVASAQNWKLENPTTRPPARYDFAMSNSQGGNVLIFGGTTLEFGFAYLNDTWVWDGSSWQDLTSLTTPANRPPVRGFASMAFDAGHNQVVLFGGQSYNPPYNLNDTWVFNGSAWTKMNPTTSPPARFGASMAYDEANRRVTLFGGQGGPSNTYMGDTWVWNGTTWIRPFVTGLPPNRIGAAMAYWGAGRYLLLFGGYGASGYLRDTWQGEWSPLVDFTTLYDASMAYYPVSSKIVLFGGKGYNGLGTNTTATWGGQWSLLLFLISDPLPAPRSGARMAYDLNTGRLVLFGGLYKDNNQDLNDTWTWGKQVACLPGDGSTVRVGSIVRCFFAEETDVQFGHWTTDGFSPRFSVKNNMTFHTEEPGPASITATWFDSTGSHSETFHFTIKHRHNEGDDDRDGDDDPDGDGNH